MTKQLPWCERLALQIHLLHCAWCRRNGKQLSILHQHELKDQADLQNTLPQILSDEARSRLKSKIREREE